MKLVMDIPWAPRTSEILAKKNFKVPGGFIGIYSSDRWREVGKEEDTITNQGGEVFQNLDNHSLRKI